MTIEQTLKSDDRLSRKEACELIQETLRLSKTTVEKKTVYEPDIANTRANKKYFRRAELISALNRRLG